MKLPIVINVRWKISLVYSTEPKMKNVTRRWRHTCSVGAAVACAVLNVRYLHVVAISNWHRFHGNIADVKIVIAEASLNVQRRQVR